VRILLASTSLGTLHKAVRKGDIRINGKKILQGQLCAAGDILEVSGILWRAETPRAVSARGKGEALKIDDPSAPMRIPSSMILLETPDLLFLDKPRGMLVHDGEESLAALVNSYLFLILGDSLSFKPGPLHRLDRNTTGIVTFSKSIEGARLFSEFLRTGKIRKTYLTIMTGEIHAPAVWTDMLARDEKSHTSSVIDAHCCRNPSGKPAETRVYPLHAHEGMTLARIEIGTGRTHQIRVQAAFHGHPLIGDRKYSRAATERKYFLHAWMLDLAPAMLTGLPEKIVAPLPEKFRIFLAERLHLEGKALYSVLGSSKPQEEY